MGDFCDDLFEIAELAGGAANFELASGIDDGDAGGVVAAVFELAQAFDDDGNNFLRADVADNSAHAGTLLMGILGSVACAANGPTGSCGYEPRPERAFSPAPSLEVHCGDCRRFSARFAWRLRLRRFSSA